MGCGDSKVHHPDAIEKVVAANDAAADHVGSHSDRGRVPSKTDPDTQSTTCSFSIRQSVPETIVTSPDGSRLGSKKSGASMFLDPGTRVVLGRYVIDCGKENSLGEGTSSVCYLGVDMETGDQVAIKEYKNKGRNKVEATFTKFKRQVAVLLELQKPFERPADETFWSKDLAAVEPSELFVKLVDFSKDEKGEPRQHPIDGSMYIVTELADFTMKSVLRKKHEQNETLTAEQVRKFAKEICLAVAGLHCKGFVHLDLKPENVMLFGGRWKLIDMDGCVRAGDTLRQHDSSVSFSPCYCAPEFARFIVNGGSIVVQPGLDAWSVGMTIAELVSLSPILKSHYQQFTERHSHKTATTHVLRWISNLRAVPLPKPVLSADPSFVNLLKDRLLVIDQTRRSTVAECLSTPLFQV